MEKLVTYLIICTIPEKLLFVSLLKLFRAVAKNTRSKSKQEKELGSQATRNSIHCGRQRRPHKDLCGFWGLFLKRQFRGCSNFNLADLGVAEISADFAGYSRKFVVLCCAWKGEFLCRKNC